MFNFLIGRTITSILTLILLSIIVFSILHLSPGDPARMMLPMESSEEEVLQMRKSLGLDRPLVVQYVSWLRNAVQLDFGMSIRSKDSAAKSFLERLPATLELAFASIILSVVLAIPVGILAAIKRSSVWDFAISFVSVFSFSVPRFWLGILFIILFSLVLGWFPPYGRGPGLMYGISQLFVGDFETLWAALRHLLLPAVTLGTWFFTIFLKYTRASILEELGKLYVKTARQKGVGELRVLLVHVLRNALIPIVTVIGLQLGSVIGGAVIVEIVFSWPGAGQLLMQALFARDYPLIQASLFMIGAMIVGIFILLDILYVLIDPRIIYKKA